MQKDYIKLKKFKTLILFLLSSICVLLLTSCSGNTFTDLIGKYKLNPTLLPNEETADTPVPTKEISPTVKPAAKSPKKSITASTPTPVTKPTKEPTPTSKQVKGSSPTSKPTKAPTKVLTKAPAPTEKPTKNLTVAPTLDDTDKRLKDDAENILDKIITKNMKDVDKVKAVHDYIVLNTKYDYDNLINNTIPEASFTAEGVLRDQKAVCQGYAYAFQLFMELLGIDSKVVVGTDLKNNIGHAWNMVKLNGNWYQVDTTWDDPVPDQKEIVQYQYFLVTDKVLRADHEWNKNDYPVCNSTEYQYYIYKDDIIDSVDQYEKKFMERYDAGDRTITILYPEEVMPNFDFFYNYDYLWKLKNGKYTVSKTWYPPWRLGDYTVLTVIME